MPSDKDTPFDKTYWLSHTTGKSGIDRASKGSVTAKPDILLNADSASRPFAFLAREAFFDRLENQVDAAFQTRASSGLLRILAILDAHQSAMRQISSRANTTMPDANGHPRAHQLGAMMIQSASTNDTLGVELSMNHDASVTKALAGVPAQADALSQLLSMDGSVPDANRAGRNHATFAAVERFLKTLAGARDGAAAGALQDTLDDYVVGAAAIVNEQKSTPPRDDANITRRLAQHSERTLSDLHETLAGYPHAELHAPVTAILAQNQAASQAARPAATPRGMRPMSP